jgi:hypothetical protein
MKLIETSQVVSIGNRTPPLNGTSLNSTSLDVSSTQSTMTQSKI